MIRDGIIRFDRRYVDQESVTLADRFTHLLEVGPIKGRTVKLHEGDVLFFNNHKMLHAREAYTDVGRVSLRVRIQAFENANMV